MHESIEGFWDVHRKIKTFEDVDSEFKGLFESMVHKTASRRATISDIKKNPWFNRPIYTNEELIKIMKPIMEKKRLSKSVILE